MIEELIRQLETVLENELEPREDDPREIFENALWTIENIDKVVEDRLSYKGFLPSDGRVEQAKIGLLSSLCSQVSVVWDTVNDNSEIEELGERVLNLACDELDKLNALK